MRRPGGTRGADVVSEPWAIARFALSGLVAVAIVLVLVLVAVERAARAEVIRGAEDVARAEAVGVVAPLSTDGVVRGDPDAIARLRARVQSAILRGSDQDIVLYRADGRVVWSSSGQARRGSFGGELGYTPAVREAAATGRSVTWTDRAPTLSSSPRLLEIYQPITGADGQRLVVQSCRLLTSVSDSSRQMLSSYGPWLIGGVLLLQLVNLPLALRLVRRVKRLRRREEALLERQIAASDRERRRLASDLHNGVIQEIAGLSMALAAARHRASARGDAEAAAQLDEVAAGSRRTTRTLRHMLVDIYPPNLQRAGLRTAIADLLDGVRRREVAVDAELAEALDDLDADTAAVVYRVVQEALRNAVVHAEPDALEVRVTVAGGTVRFVVADDGRGFALDEAYDNGHLGLELMHDLVAQAGGRLDVASAAGEGTTVRGEVPAA